MGMRRTADIKAFQKRTGIEPGQPWELLRQMSDAAFELIKVIEGKSLSPVLVVGGAAGTDIADGFHLVSLVYRLDPYAVVPLRLAESEPSPAGG